MSDTSRDPSKVSLPPEPVSGAASEPVPLHKDSVFGGLLSTQFLGAFNDNYFKQIVLLKCAELAAGGNADRQPLALAAFALPFVMISGFAGFLSDRYSKRKIIVLCKVAEIAVMAASLVVLASGVESQTQILLLILVLGFMGAQSAFFGPAKYGILPELFPGKRLTPVNGAIQMTTFLAIIFGTATAGYALDSLDDSLWLCSLVAIGIAVMGTFTSLLVRPTPVAQPDIPFQTDNLFMPKDVRAFLRDNPQLFKTLIVMSLFWFIGGLAHPGVNLLGEQTLSLSKTRTSLMAASIGVGLAVGCVTAGVMNRSSRSANSWIRRGAWLMVVSLLAVAYLGSGSLGLPAAAGVPAQGLIDSMFAADSLEWSLRGAMLLLGFAAGVFVIPVQVFIQHAPPPRLKGRMIGAMNLMTWIGILLSAGFLKLVNLLIGMIDGKAQVGQSQYLLFIILAVLTLPIALLYRLPDKHQAADI